jgi:hypothetical protein
MMQHLLLRLHGDEDWAAWGDDWLRHADVLGELSWVKGWSLPPEWLGEGKQLDWGAFLHELSGEDVRRLVDEPSWLAAAETAQRQRELLQALSATESYGVVYVELY